jgi:crotonobetainyl-CoA:carnitine CoA-transferase CaiB-like acyl-CoA transferase
MSFREPYKGLKVLDISQGFAGPYCAGLFSMYGAEVIKVEPPEGDWIRGIGRSFGGQTPLSIVGNRGKKSICLNLKAEQSRQLIMEMSKDADLMVESFRPGVAARLGVGYEAVKKVNPKIIYVAVSGFGQTGPYSGRPGSDTVIQSFSGLCGVNIGNDGVPHRVGMLVPDTTTGMYAFQAAQAALAGRHDEDEGTFIDANLSQAMGAYMAPKIIEYHLEGGDPRILNAPAGSYETADGYVGIALVKEPQFRIICECLGLPELADDPRYENFETRAAHMETLGPAIAARFKERPTDEWVKGFREHDILADKIYSYGDWLEDEHVKQTRMAPMLQAGAVGAFPWPTIPGMATEPDGETDMPPPETGADGREILAAMGKSEAEIEALLAAGALTLPGEDKAA